MSRFGGNIHPGLAAANSLASSLHPMTVLRTMEVANRVAQQNQQQETFSNLLRQHNVELRNDPEYRRHFNSVQKKNPSALMSLQGLSEARGRVGMITENMRMLGELEKRIDTFAASPMGQTAGFNPEFKRQELKRIAKLIQEDPEVGNQALFQEMGTLSAAMQHAHNERQMFQFFQDMKGKSAEEQLVALREIPITQDMRERLQDFILKEVPRSRGQQASAGFNAAIAASTEIQSEDQLQQFKQQVAQELQNSNLTAEEAQKAFSAAETNFKQARSREESAEQQINFTENVTTLVDELAVQGFEPTMQGLTGYVKTEEGQKFFKNITGFDSIGEARRGIQNFDAILQERFQQSLDVESNNKQIRKSFEEAGGSTIIRDKPIALPATDITGTLVIPVDDSNIAVYNKVPPASKIESGRVFDDRGLPGVTGMRLSATIVHGPNNEPVEAMVTSFDAIRTRQTNPQDQVAVYLSDIDAKPLIFKIPVVGGRLDQRGRTALNIAEYARDVARVVDPDGNNPRIDLLFKSIDAFESAVRSEMHKATGVRKEHLKKVDRNLSRLVDTVTVTFESEGLDPSDDPFGFAARKRVKPAQRDTREAEDLFISALTQFYTEYARFNAVMTNSFVDREPADANP